MIVEAVKVPRTANERSAMVAESTPAMPSAPKASQRKPDRAAVTVSFPTLSALNSQGTTITNKITGRQVIRKCARGFVSTAGSRPGRLDSGIPLIKFDVNNCLRYLGTDIVLRKGTGRKVANRRLAAFRKSASLFKTFPANNGRESVMLFLLFGWMGAPITIRHKSDRLFLLRFN